MTARRRRICLVNAWAASNRAIIRDMTKNETPAETYARIAGEMDDARIPAYGKADLDDIAYLCRRRDSAQQEQVRYEILADLQRSAPRK